MTSRVFQTLTLSLALLLALAGCPSDKGDAGEAAGTEAAAPAAELTGVDLENKVLTIGALNDESGPGATIGKPYAVGKRLLAAKINAGGSGLLPEGWTVKLVERDHGYNPQKAVQYYSEIKDEVLFIGTSFGTPNTLPLRDMLAEDKLVAFPASLSSKMAEFEFTPPVGAPYTNEAERAVDWFVETAGGADKIKIAVVYQKDDYGQDGLEGAKAAAARHGTTIVSEQPVAPGQADFVATVTALKEAGATHVVMTVLPSATGKLLGTAAKMGFMPTWVGSTPSWIDLFFNPEVVPPVVFTNFYWATGLSFWGEEGVKGMADFVSTYDAHGKELGPKDFYVLTSYAQGVVQIEAFRRALEAGDMSRAGYLKALRSMADYDARGLLKPLDFSKYPPYETSDQVRILKPMMAEKTWSVAGDYATPGAAAAAPAPEAEAAPEAAPAAPAPGTSPANPATK